MQIGRPYTCTFIGREETNLAQLKHRSAIVEAVKPLLENYDSHLRLIDVGASGGIEPFWRQWEPHFTAECFDPLLAEVDRLNLAEKNRSVTFHAMSLTCDGYVPPAQTGDAWHCRTSFHRAVEAMQLNYQQQQYNAGAEISVSDKWMTLDKFCQNKGIDDVDFLKTDTDGSDYYVLRGAADYLSRCGVLGVFVECTFYSVGQNNFANIDLLMRDAGFLLFDIEPWRYTHRALPGMFVFGLPAQTETGPIHWCDALYMRPPEDGLAFLPSSHADRRGAKALKLAALYDTWGYPDQAAALLLDLEKREMLPHGLDVEAMLDALVPVNEFGITRYREYVAKFDTDPRQFYPKQHRPSPVI